MYTSLESKNAPSTNPETAAALDTCLTYSNSGLKR